MTAVAPSNTYPPPDPNLVPATAAPYGPPPPDYNAPQGYGAPAAAVQPQGAAGANAGANATNNTNITIQAGAAAAPPMGPDNLMLSIICCILCPHALCPCALGFALVANQETENPPRRKSYANGALAFSLLGPLATIIIAIVCIVVFVVNVSDDINEVYSNTWNDWNNDWDQGFDSTADAFDNAFDLGTGFADDVFNAADPWNLDSSFGTWNF